MYIILYFLLAEFKEVSSPSGLIEHTALIIRVIRNKFIGFHIDVVQIRTAPGQRMGNVTINYSTSAGLFVGPFQLAPVFLLIIGYAKNDLFFIIFLNQRGPQAYRYAFSIHQHPVIMNQGTVLMYFRQHVFFREHPQMSLQIFRGNCLWRIRHNIGKKVFSQLCQTNIFISLRRVVLGITTRFGIDRIKNDVVRRQRSDPA